MSRRVNLLSISGGKDSTAMLLHAIERGVEFRCVFADTGHEHEDTYAYLAYLESRLGVSIQRVKADFTLRIKNKAEYIRTHWFDDLTTGREGWWIWRGEDEAPELPYPPDNPFRPEERGNWIWRRAMAPLSPESAQATVDSALKVLVPTGNPFLDMCIWKGRFPSPKGRFCTDELKTLPITDQVVWPILKSGIGVRSWQGVRREESPRRAKYNPHEQIDFGVWVYRPLLEWNVDEVFAIHRRHDIQANPLYLKGMGRVGCMPCIMCRKGELAEISKRFPEVIERLAHWEKLVSTASKRGSSTFFDVRPIADDRYDVDYIRHGVDAAVRWSRTGRGGRQYDLFDEFAEIPSCSSHYGLCELPE